MDCSLPDSSVHGISQARILGWVPFLFPEYRPNSRVETASPTMACGFFTTEPPGSPGRNMYFFKSIYLFLVTLVFVAVNGLSLVVVSRGLLSSCGAWAYHRRGLSCCGARTLERAGFIRQSWSMGFIAPWHVGSSQTRD